MRCFSGVRLPWQQVSQDKFHRRGLLYVLAARAKGTFLPCGPSHVFFTPGSGQWDTPLLVRFLFPDRSLQSLPLPLLRHGTSTAMADKEKRRSGVPPPPPPPGMPEGNATRSDSDREFLSQAGLGELLRGAILKMVEARSDDPIGFLADHFCNLAATTERGTAGCGDADQQLSNGPPSASAQEQQHLNRALWHLRLAHHSQRSAFSNNVCVAYDLLNLTGPHRHPGEAPEGPDGSCTESPTGGGGGGGGGVRGGLYTQTLECLCSEGGVPASTFAPLLRRLHCQDHEAVPYEVFRHGVLTCAVFSDYIRQAQRLYAEVCCPDDGPASRALSLAVLGTLKEALETSQGCEANCCVNANTKGNSCLEAKAICYLKASSKISPCKLAQAMSGAQARGPGGNMDAKEFENAAAELFITRVKVVS